MNYEKLQSLTASAYFWKILDTCEIDTNEPLFRLNAPINFGTHGIRVTRRDDCSYLIWVSHVLNEPGCTTEVSVGSEQEAGNRVLTLSTLENTPDGLALQRWLKCFGWQQPGARKAHKPEKLVG